MKKYRFFLNLEEEEKWLTAKKQFLDIDLGKALHKMLLLESITAILPQPPTLKIIKCFSEIVDGNTLQEQSPPVFNISKE